MTTTLTADDVRSWCARVAGVIEGDLDQLNDELGELETLKHAIEARQAVLALEVDRLMRDRASAQGVPAARQGKGVAEYVAAARRISPAQGRVVVAVAKQLRCLPQTFARYRAGDLSEYKATLITREAGCLDPRDQQRLDARVAVVPGLKTMGNRKLAHRVQTIALQLDEEAVVRRRERAVEDRHVTIRPTDRGDGMAWLSALLPVEQAATVKQALEAAADTAVAFGGATSRAQAMADTLVARVTTGTGAIAQTPPVHPVTVSLVMTDTTLLDRDDTQPAFLPGHGPIPGSLARRLIRIAEQNDQKVELRRLFADPDSGELVRMESKARLFPKALSTFIRLRDQLCRTPACGARIAHIDHVDDWSTGGSTSASNGEGLCRQCNWARQVIRAQTSRPPALIEPRSPLIQIDIDYQRAA